MVSSPRIIGLRLLRGSTITGGEMCMIKPGLISVAPSHDKPLILRVQKGYFPVIQIVLRRDDFNLSLLYKVFEY